MLAKIKELVQLWLEEAEKREIELILGIGMTLLSLLAFGAGYLVAKEQLKEPLRLEQVQE